MLSSGRRPCWHDVNVLDASGEQRTAWWRSSGPGKAGSIWMASMDMASPFNGGPEGEQGGWQGTRRLAAEGQAVFLAGLETVRPVVPGRMRITKGSGRDEGGIPAWHSQSFIKAPVSSHSREGARGRPGPGCIQSGHPKAAKRRPDKGGKGSVPLPLRDRPETASTVSWPSRQTMQQGPWAQTGVFTQSRQNLGGQVRPAHYHKAHQA
jgi:hypothetical protein